MAISLASSFLLANSSAANGTLAAGNNSFTTGAFTPTDNSLLVVVTNWYGAVVTTPGSNTANISISANTGLSGWVTQIANGYWYSGNQFDLVQTVFTVPIIGAGVPMTIKQQGYKAGGIIYFSCHAFCITEYNTSVPIGAIAQSNVQTSGAMSITLSGTPASTSLVIAGTGWIPNASGAVTANGAGWTKVYDDVNAQLCMEDQWITGLVSTTVPWANQCSGDGPYNGLVRQFAIEVQAAPYVSAPTYITQDNSSGTTATTWTTPNFTSTNNSLLIAVQAVSAIGTAGGTWNNATATGITFTTSGITWNNYTSGYYSCNNTAYGTLLAVSVANVITGNATTNVIVANVAGNFSKVYNIALFSVTGANSTYGVTGVNTNIAIAGAANVSLSSAPSINSCVLGVRTTMCTGGGGLANAGSGWTNTYNAFIGSGFLGLHVMHRINSTSANVVWDTCTIGDTPSRSSETIFGVELLAYVATNVSSSAAGIMIGL